MTLRRGGRAVVIHTPLSPEGARARLRSHLAGESLGSQFVEVQPGWYVVGWLQTDPIADEGGPVRS
ncbi:MAG: hypothetical protein R2746_00145 [Acidimicrobiales bacterium]